MSLIQVGSDGKVRIKNNKIVIAAADTVCCCSQYIEAENCITGTAAGLWFLLINSTTISTDGGNRTLPFYFSIGTNHYVVSTSGTKANSVSSGVMASGYTEETEDDCRVPCEACTETPLTWTISAGLIDLCCKPSTGVKAQGVVNGTFTLTSDPADGQPCRWLYGPISGVDLYSYGTSDCSGSGSPNGETFWWELIIDSSLGLHVNCRNGTKASVGTVFIFRGGVSLDCGFDPSVVSQGFTCSSGPQYGQNGSVTATPNF